MSRPAGFDSASSVRSESFDAEFGPEAGSLYDEASPGEPAKKSRLDALGAWVV